VVSGKRATGYSDIVTALALPRAQQPFDR
jgi:hypothetical protein